MSTKKTTATKSQGRKTSTLEKILPQIRAGAMFSHTTYEHEIEQPLKEGQKKADKVKILQQSMRLDTGGGLEGKTIIIAYHRGGGVGQWNFGTINDLDLVLGDGWFMVGEE
jgi:predicted methyltransferase